MHEDAPPQPVSPYGVTKLAAEQLCHLYFVNHQVPTVSLRYFTVYGPRQRPDMGFHRFFSAVLDGRPVVQFGDGLQTRDFTFVADAVTATATAAVRGLPGRVYNIGGGSRVSLQEVFELIARVSNRPLRIDHRTAKGRHARHLRRHVARPRRSGFRAVGDARGGVARDVALDGIRHDEYSKWALPLAAFVMLVAGCAAKNPAMPAGTADADKFLFDRGTEAAQNGSGSTPANTSAISWTTIRKARTARTRSWRLATPTFPRKPSESLLLGAQEFREFLTFYPTHPRADYAQLQLAQSFAKQMLAPQRDQSATQDAIKEIEIFLHATRTASSCPKRGRSSARRGIG